MLSELADKLQIALEAGIVLLLALLMSILLVWTAILIQATLLVWI